MVGGLEIALSWPSFFQSRWLSPCSFCVKRPIAQQAALAPMPIYYNRCWLLRDILSSNIVGVPLLLQMLNTCAILPVTKLVVLLISGGKLYGNWEQLH